ncbi:hypothetical protein BDV93DRAFT_504599 [Ceratobasidium sp. AG-I]|nr:hypothetical protein BDV93DRAFT_504599 [Ceratobasidium sp. AG-I]
MAQSPHCLFGGVTVSLPALIPGPHIAALGPVFCVKLLVLVDGPSPRGSAQDQLASVMAQPFTHPASESRAHCARSPDSSAAITVIGAQHAKRHEQWRLLEARWRLKGRAVYSSTYRQEMARPKVRTR